MASAIAGPDPLIEAIPERQRQQNARDPWPPAPAPDRPAHRDPRDGLRWWPWSRRTISWQAAYNTACLYAALAAQRLATMESLPAAERRAWDERVVTSLGRVVNNQYAEMERPYDTFSQDPDFSALRSAPGQFPAFRKFLDDQRRVDYPEADVAQARLGLADLPHRGQPANAAAQGPLRGRVRRDTRRLTFTRRLRMRRLRRPGDLRYGSLDATVPALSKVPGIRRRSVSATSVVSPQAHMRPH